MTVLPKFAKVAAGVMLALIPVLARAQGDTGDPIDTGDTALVLGLGLIGLALAMPGVVLHHGGQLRGRMFATISTETAAIAAIVSLLWVVVGYTLAFGAVGNGWIGNGNAWMLIDLATVRPDSGVPEIAFVFLQLGFAVLAASLLTGSWAERGNLAWVVPFAGLWSVMVYAPITHWIKGGGWLAAQFGTVDYGGSLSVHASVGISALIIALIMGRRERFAGVNTARGDAPGLGLAGTGLVWGAIMALTAGATLAASDDAGAALVNLQVAAAAGGLSWLMLDAMAPEGADAGSMARGVMAGLVAACAAAQAMAPGGAIVAGLAGTMMAWAAMRLIRWSAIDDAVNLVAVHGVGGLAGALLAAPLIAGTLGGSGYAAGVGPVRQVIAQVLAAVVVVAWSAIGTAITALMVATIIPMRISEHLELAGPGRD